MDSDRLALVAITVAIIVAIVVALLLLWTPIPGAASTVAPLRSASPSGSSSGPTAREAGDEPGRRVRVAARASVSGIATWYCDPPRSRCTRGYPASGMYAAAGSEISRWRGRLVRVTATSGRSVVVRLIDSCACRGDRIIDLYRVAMRQLYGRLGGGRVTVTLVGGVLPTLPPTDTAE